METETESQRLGVDIVLDAVKAPLRQMASNAGHSPDLVVSLVEAEEGALGYDYQSGEITDMLEGGVVDPTKVTRCALQNAASVAGTLITTNYAIIEE